MTYRKAAARSWCGHREMTAKCLCDFTGTAWASCGNFAIAAQGMYSSPKSLRSSCDIFVPNDHLKSCDLRTIRVRPACDASMEGLRAMGLKFLNFGIMQS